MGLDITAYGNLKRIGKHEKTLELNEGEPGSLDDWCYYDGHVQAYAYDNFPESFRGIEVLSVKDGILQGGCFEVTPETEKHRAGSYSGYNRWRENLATQFNPDRDPNSPFYELIWFADNEGCIGPDAARDLLADFRKHEGIYEPFYELNDIYADFKRSCELAANGGLIDFH